MPATDKCLLIAIKDNKVSWTRLDITFLLGSSKCISSSILLSQHSCANFCPCSTARTSFVITIYKTQTIGRQIFFRVVPCNATNYLKFSITFLKK